MSEGSERAYHEEDLNSEAASIEEEFSLGRMVTQEIVSALIA